MKKFIALLFSFGLFATSFAQNQPGKRNSHEYVTNKEYKKLDSHRDNIYTFTAQNRDVYISKINRDFKAKVKAIQNNSHLTKGEKKELIAKADAGRKQQIQIVNNKFNSRYNSAYNYHERKTGNDKH